MEKKILYLEIKYNTLENAWEIYEDKKRIKNKKII
jgi:hypothetical protein